MKKFLLSTVAIASFATVVHAQDVYVESLIAEYQAAGFTGIEIYDGTGFVKVEAYQNGSKYEFIYDRATGQLIRTEVEVHDDDDDAVRTTVDYSVVADAEIEDDLYDDDEDYAEHDDVDDHDDADDIDDDDDDDDDDDHDDDDDEDDDDDDHDDDDDDDDD